MAVVNKTLVELKANDKPVILVFNKIDGLLDELGEQGLEERVATLRQSYLTKEGVDAVFISATNKTNIDELKEKLTSQVGLLASTMYLKR